MFTACSAKRLVKTRFLLRTSAESQARVYLLTHALAQLQVPASGGKQIIFNTPNKFVLLCEARDSAALGCFNNANHVRDPKDNLSKGAKSNN